MDTSVVYETHPRDCYLVGEHGERSLAYSQGDIVTDYYDKPIVKGDDKYRRHLFTVFSPCGQIVRYEKGEIFINGRGHAQPLILGSQPPKITYEGIKDGEQSINLKKHHEALRESRTVKGITHNLKHMETRELLKLRDAVLREVAKR